MCWHVTIQFGTSYGPQVCQNIKNESLMMPGSIFTAFSSSSSSTLNFNVNIIVAAQILYR